MNDQLYNLNSANANDKARLILSMMSPDMVNDIVILAGRRGSSLVTDIFGPESQFNDTPRALGILSREYVRDADVPELITGLSTILLAAYRKTTWGVSDYAKLLSDGWAIPEKLALKLASDIETQDLVVAADGSTDSLRESWDWINAKIQNSVASLVNSATSLLGIPWMMNSSQKFDADFMYELSQLGATVNKLNKRSRLVMAQMAINQALGAKLSAGDPSDDIQGDVDYAVGDVLSTLLKARKLFVPSFLSGVKSNLVNVTQESAIDNAKQLLASAGYVVSPQGGLTDGGVVTNPYARRSIESALSGDVSDSFRAGFTSSPRPSGKLSVSGSNDFDLVGDVVANQHGIDVANAWAAGDIDSIVKNAFKSADANVNTGDPRLDDALESQLGDLIYEDLDGMTPEIGGLFARWRLNSAKKRAVRKKRKAIAKGTRISNREAMKSESARLRNDRRNTAAASYIEDPALEDPDDYVADTVEVDSFSDTETSPDMNLDGISV